MHFELLRARLCIFYIHYITKRSPDRLNMFVSEVQLPYVGDHIVNDDWGYIYIDFLLFYILYFWENVMRNIYGELLLFSL